MAEVAFYHLTRSRADDALPPLLAKTLAAEKRAFVCCSKEKFGPLSTAIWSRQPDSWLPHGISGKHDSAAESCPIWLSDKADDNGNNAGFLSFLMVRHQMICRRRNVSLLSLTARMKMSSARPEPSGSILTVLAIHSVTGNRMTPVNGHGRGDCCLGGASGLVIHRRRIYKAISARMILAVTCLHKGKFNGS